MITAVHSRNEGLSKGESQFLCGAVQPSDFSRPFGTRCSQTQRDPRLESLGYCRMSLRDMPKSELRPLSNVGAFHDFFFMQNAIRSTPHTAFASCALSFAPYVLR